MIRAPRLRRLRTQLLKLLRSPLTVSPIDTLLSRATRGERPGSFLARIPPGNQLYQRPTRRRAIRSGITYELDISDFVEWTIYYGIKVEPRDKLYGLAGLGETVVDVGANVGECALNFARRVGPAGRVLSFEPGPVARSKLKRNIALNAFANIEVLDFGLGEAAATVSLCTPAPRNRGGNRILEKPVGDYVNIQVRSLDEFIEERGIERVHLMKVDVEGFELRLLRGARRTIAKSRPKLFVEVSDGLLRGSGTSASELLKTIADWGYEMKDAESDTRVSPDQRLQDTHFDVIATPA